MRGSFVTDLDLATKVILIIFLVILSYIGFLLLLQPLFVPQQIGRNGMMEMMRRMMGYSYENTLIYNLTALLLAVGVGLTASLLIRTRSGKEGEYRILQRALSEDEKRALDEIRRAGVITQDSLTLRLDWSKAKVSRILTNLDKMNLIQRERTGKTYKVFMTKED